MSDIHEIDRNIKIWKINKLIKDLKAAQGQGNGTVMILLTVPPGDQLSRVMKLLEDEYLTAMETQSRLVLRRAVTSAQERLGHYREFPPNGLVLCTGIVLTKDGKEENTTIDFEPVRPMSASLNVAYNELNAKALKELLEADGEFGFIVMDGNNYNTLFGSVSGYHCTPTVLHNFSAGDGAGAGPLKKCGAEERDDYFRKTAKLATQLFIDPSTRQPNVLGLILVGSNGFKTELRHLHMFDPRLRAKILKYLDVAGEGVNAFYMAYFHSECNFTMVKSIPQDTFLGRYFDEIERDPGRCIYGVDDTLKSLEMGAVEILVVNEDLEVNRHTLKNTLTGEVLVKHLNKEQELDKNNFWDSATSAELVVQEKMSLLDWLADEYKRFGCRLEFVTDESLEGHRFKMRHSGIGGILRCPPEDTVDFELYGPKNEYLYLLNSKFHTDALNKLLQSDEKVGYIVMDGKVALFGTRRGNTREVLHKFSIDIPEEQARRALSGRRFGPRQQLNRYVCRTVKLAKKYFIDWRTLQPNVSGLILAGAAGFKIEVNLLVDFNYRLRTKILDAVDVPDGGEDGFHQAIELSAC